MGAKKTELHGRVEAGIEKGREIEQTAESKIEEAEVSNNALSRIEAADDDTQMAADTARSEAASEAASLAQSEIKEPGDALGERFNETTAESSELGEREMENAESAREMTGDYTDIGSGLAEQLRASGEEFLSISEESAQTNNEFPAEFSQKAAQLEGAFS